MFGNLGELAGMMKNFQNIQSNMKRMKEELAELEITGKSNCGQVDIILSGDMHLKHVKISPEITALNDHAALEFAVSEALTSALAQLKAEAARRLSEATGGIKIPGLTE